MASVPYTEPDLDDFGVPRTPLPLELQDEIDAIRWVAYHCAQFGEPYQRLIYWEIHHDPRLAFVFPTHSRHESFKEAEQFYKELKSSSVDIESPFAYQLSPRLSIRGIVEQRKAIAKLRANELIIDHYINANSDLQKKLEEAEKGASKTEAQLALAFFRDFKLKMHIHKRNDIIREKNKQLSEKDKIISDLRDELHAYKEASARQLDEHTRTIQSLEERSRVSATNVVKISRQLRDAEHQKERMKQNLECNKVEINTLESRVRYAEALEKMEHDKKDALKSGLYRLIRQCEAWGEDVDDSTSSIDAVASNNLGNAGRKAQRDIEAASRGSSLRSPSNRSDGLVEAENTNNSRVQRSDAPSPHSSSTSPFLVASVSSLVSSFADSVG